jgi:heparan-alpha-glucosaminide N-acetyltransferase
MAATPPSPSPSLTERIASIDVFRGLTMLVMLFTNDIGDADLGHIANAPTWLRHVLPKVDTMTMPDVIWPCFMFIVGLSIPLSLERRLARGDSLLELSWHILLRAGALIFIGLCLVNGCYGVPLNEAAMHISGPLWRLLMFLGVILLWNGYPQTESWTKWLFVALRVAGAALLVYLLVIYRATEGDHTIWIRSRWWGIIALIGWAYLVAAFVWLGCRSQAAAVMGAMALAVTLNISAQAGPTATWWQSHVNGFLPELKDLTWLWSTTAAGMAIGTLFRPNPAATTPRSRIIWLLVFAAGFAVAGLLFRPFWGINKPGATPSWIFYSLAIACVLYAFLYWLVDVQKISRWTVLIAPAGSNTLLMYFLPHIFYALLALGGVTYLQTHFHEGWLGVARSAVLAVCFVAVTGLLSRCRIRLHL